MPKQEWESKLHDLITKSLNSGFVDVKEFTDLVSQELARKDCENHELTQSLLKQQREEIVEECCTTCKNMIVLKNDRKEI